MEDDENGLIRQLVNQNFQREQTEAKTSRQSNTKTHHFRSINTIISPVGNVRFKQNTERNVVFSLIDDSPRVFNC